MDVSIVVPLFNEVQSVEPLCARIVRAMEPLDRSFETILVDDGSTDETFERARGVAVRDARFTVVKLSKNFGQTAALYAGIERARGAVIVTMDGDLQNDPADIGRLLRRVEAGYDVVAGWRADRKDRLVYRKVPSRAANWLIRKVAGTAIKDNGCALRAYRAGVIKRFPLYSEMHRLLPTILSLAGARIAQVEVRHHARQYGASKYGLSRVYKVLFDLVALKTVMTSARLPLFGFGSAAFLAALLGVLSLGLGLALGPADTAPTSEGDSMVVFFGVSLLWGALSAALLMFGVLCTLVYARGKLKVEDLLRVEAL